MRTEPRLRLDDRFTHLVSAAGSLILVGDEDALVLDHALAGSVVRLLDGRRTAVDIAERLGHHHPPAEVHFVLLHLLDAGLAREVSEAPNEGPDTLQGHPAGVLAASLASLWRGRGAATPVVVPSAVWAGPEGCRLVLTDDYLRPELGRDPATIGPDGVPPVLLAGLAARRVWLGPVLSSDAGCIACLQDRLRLNLTGRSLVHLAADARGGAFDVVALPGGVPSAAFAALASTLPRRPEDLAGLADRLSVFPLEDGSVPATHRVPRLPDCPACGDPSLTVPGPRVELRSMPRSPGSKGGYRIVGPEATLATYAPLVSPLVGVVRRVESVPVEGQGPVHVYTASHAHHYGAGNVRAVKDDRRDHSGGKGRTDLDARASALCESLERFSGVHRGSEPARRARLSELEAAAYAPNELMHFSEAQFAGRETWNATQAGGFQSVPEPYDDQEIEWSAARSLRTGEVLSVPTSFLFLGYRGDGRRFCDGDSNGLAGGNCLEEAILQGFLELVERDAVALWWYNRALRPGVDLSSVDDLWVGEVVRYYDGLGRDVWVLDLTTDLDIPTYAGLSSLRRDREQDIIFGFGSHLDARIALSRALTELNQMLPTVFQTRDVRRRSLLPDFADAVAWWDEATLEAHPYLMPRPDTALRTLPAAAGVAGGDLRDDVLTCVRRAGDVGCDVLVHDLTRPDVGFPVAKVIVPGLRHFWRRLGRGRLYDVPVALGWVGRPPDERDLNPMSMFV